MPEGTYAESVRVLPTQWLFDQASDAHKVLGTLCGGTRHVGSVVEDWHGHEAGLLRYMMAVCDEMLKRGFHARLRAPAVAMVRMAGLEHGDDPPWTRDPQVHRMHRQALIGLAVRHRRRMTSLGAEHPVDYVAHFDQFWPDERTLIRGLAPGLRRH